MTRYALCALGGALVALSMPPWGFWPLAFVGVTVFFVAIGDGLGWRQRAVCGFAFALPWMLIAMAWMWFLTPPGYLAATAIFAGFHAVAAVLAPPSVGAPLGRAAAHTLAEAFRISVPFGGVPLATLGISQSGGPLLGVARVGGVILLTWIVLQVGASVATLVRAPSQRSSAFAGVIAVGLFAVVATVAPSGRDTGETIDVAAVQGGGEQGTSALDVPSSQVTQVHLEATQGIQPDDDLDLVVWPENAIDVKDMAFVDSPKFDAVAAEAALLCVPFAVGVTDESEFSLVPRPDSFVNAQVVITPEGEATSRYEKVRIVPFGEYVPLRGVIEGLGVDLSQVARDAVRGQGPAHIDLPDGTRVGVMISWEVFFGDRGRAAADDDAGLLINPTNGASYTWSIVQTQQVASSRLRAVETGRWVVQVAPTGFSAFIAPDGTVHDRTNISEQAVIRREITLRDGTTWYHRLGDTPFTVAFVLLLIATRWHHHRDLRSGQSIAASDR